MRSFKAGVLAFVLAGSFVAQCLGGCFGAARVDARDAHACCADGSTQALRAVASDCCAQTDGTPAPSIHTVAGPAPAGSFVTARPPALPLLSAERVVDAVAGPPPSILRI